MRRCIGRSSLESCFSAAAVNLAVQAKTLLYLGQGSGTAALLAGFENGLVVGSILQVLGHGVAH